MISFIELLYDTGFFALSPIKIRNSERINLLRANLKFISDFLKS
nr:MAG TPA: hypothetical protein [Caudoviricetes sp.]